MKSYKTLFFWAFVVLALSAGIYAYLSLKKSKKPQLNALSVLPDSCLVYITSTDFFELNTKVNSQSLIADKLNPFAEISFLLNNLQEFDSLFHANEFVREEVAENRIHFAYYSEGWLVSLNLKQLGDEENTATQLVNLLKAEPINDGHYRFNTSTNKSLYFHLNEGVVLLSNTNKLVSEAINKTGSKLEKNKSFVAFKNNLSENNLLSIFVNHNLYGSSAATKKLNLNYVCRKGISAGSVEFQPSQLVINGFLQPDSSEILYSFYDQETQETKELADYLPATTISFKAYGFSSYSTLIQNIDHTDMNRDFWENVNKKALYNLRSDFEQNTGSHIIQFKLSTSESSIISMEIQDTLKSQEHLVAMSDTLFLSDSIKIYKLSSYELFSPVHLFTPLLEAETGFAALYSTHLLFAKTKEDLIQTLQYLKNNRLLNSNQSFVSYMNQHFTDEFNYIVYVSPNQSKNKESSFFNFKTSGDADPFLNFKHFSFCASHNKGQIEFRMQLLHESENKGKEQNILWTLQLDTNALIPAQGFINHISNENELLIQDEKKTLYLINAKGTILWKKKLNEKISSKIYTVDIYKNGKYQLLFNTRDAIHLIDRNGNYVVNYPVQLPAEASSEISVFDYDNNKDYRILIACKNKFIYNYNIHGTKQEKFTSVKTDDEVNLPLQYVNIGLSDYLVAMDKEGKLYTFSRKGIGRIGLRNKSIANCKAFYCDPNNSINSSYIVYVDDKNALINKISFDDRKEIVKLDSETENAEVCFKLIDDNRSMDLLLTKNNSIWSYNFSGNLISENRSTLALMQSDFYKDESHAFYYSLSEDQQEILIQDVLNQKTQTLKGSLMPFISNLFNDNKKYMILSDGAQLSCVPIN